MYLTRNDPSSPANFAYRMIPRHVKNTVPIERGGARWGEVLFCVCLRRSGEERINGMPVFAEPDPNSNECFVAVKKLRKAVFVPYVELGCPENPYKEIAAMQQIADNVHVLGCIEALEDDKYLFIVMPMCDGGDLFDIIHNQEREAPADTFSAALPEPIARTYFRQILECVNYLHNFRVGHLDISPENIMIKDGRCILIDLGCTLQVPVAPNGRRALLRPRMFGKISYLPWEVPQNHPFDGFGVDLWSLGITLFHMIVGATIGRSAVWVTRFESLLSFIDNSPQMALMTRNQNGCVMNLLNKILQGEPASRANLEEVIRDVWVASLAIPFVPLEHYIE